MHTKVPLPSAGTHKDHLALSPKDRKAVHVCVMCSETRPHLGFKQ